MTGRRAKTRHLPINPHIDAMIVGCYVARRMTIDAIMKELGLTRWYVRDRLFANKVKLRARGTFRNRRTCIDCNRPMGEMKGQRCRRDRILRLRKQQREWVRNKKGFRGLKDFGYKVRRVKGRWIEVAESAKRKP